MPLGKPEDRLTEARDRGRERDDKKPIGDEHGGPPPMDGWNRMPGKNMQRHVCKLHKRISQASPRDVCHTPRC
jgi:hypothetical protein